MKKIFTVQFILVNLFYTIYSISDYKREKIANTEIYSSFTTVYLHHDLYPEEDPKGYQDHKNNKLQIILSESVKFQKIEFMGYYKYFNPY